MTKRELRRAMVLRVLTKGPKEGLTLVQIQARTGLSFPACRRAILDLREDPTVVFVTVPVASVGYRYKVAATDTDIVPGHLNQLRHKLTRLESEHKSAEAMLARATTAEGMRLAAVQVASVEAQLTLVRVQVEQTVRRLADGA